MLGGNSNPFQMPVVPAGYGYGGGSGWNDDWLALLVIAMICGYGGFGFGGFSGGMFPFMMGGYPMGGFTGNYATAADVQRGFDNQAVINKLNGLENGLCSLGYDQLAQMNGINSNITATGYNIERAVQADTIANMQNQFALQRAIDANTTADAVNAGNIMNKIQECCCDEQMRSMQAEYNAQARSCATNTQLATSTRDLIDNQNAGIRSIYDKLCQMENNAKDDRIASMAQKINQLELERSQTAQNLFVQNLVKPPINPCYIAQNPYCSCGNANNYYGLYGTMAA